MKIIKKVSEDDMIACFLQAEFDSKRFQEYIQKILTENNLTPKIITDPNLNDLQENKIRYEVLTGYRGWGNRTLLFENFPEKVDWYEVELDNEEVERIKYIKMDYWDKLSDDTRLASVAAKNIKAGKVVFDKSNDNFLEAAAALRDGKNFPRLILVAKNKNSDLVVLEGHLRLTVYALESDRIPTTVEAILGISEEMTKWPEY